MSGPTKKPLRDLRFMGFIEFRVEGFLIPVNTALNKVLLRLCGRVHGIFLNRNPCPLIMYMRHIDFCPCRGYFGNKNPWRMCKSSSQRS